WENDKHITVDKQTDARIWEVQISDFSSSPSSGVSKENRGKYLAFTENGTTVNSVSGSASTCVDYLKQLGVNFVQINPFYDFGSVDETDNSGNDNVYNWGYDPVNYNCPEGSYSSNPYKGAVRIKECKQMIQALHNAGIGVIMDVVYNHTHEWKKSAFNLTVPYYYYRMNSDGTYSNGSGCGNDTASEHKMFRKFMVDSVTYWASEYHIDGFRFDLMGLHDVDTMNAIRASLDKLDGGEKLLMYGEPWNLNTTADSGTVLANNNNISRLSDRIGAFDDTYRDALKGSTSGNDSGFIQSGQGKANLKTGITGQSSESTGWAKAPSQCVTYASCHDNLTLWDKLVKSVKGSNVKFTKRYNDLVSMNKLAGAITYTSQGISFMLAGEELCRTKNGDENSYKSGVKLNQIDWNNLYKYGDVSDYYKGLIEIRKNISAFTDASAETANSIEFLSDMPEGVLAYTLNDPNYKKVLVIFNSS
ncbi:MAG: type I pullulanase, partial [Ruminococcus sp.]|nr:type I pullulanase [Ruminococcus sp.]